MNWYYAAGNEKTGPFTDENFASLVALGVVKGDTMVWHEGLAGWQAYREIAAPSEVAPEAPGVMAACAQCGRSVPPAELTLWEGRRVCPDCAPVAAGVTRAELADNRAVTIRKEHLKHEAALKFIGTAYILFSSLFLFSIPLELATTGKLPADFTLSDAIAFLVLPACCIPIGIGLRRLRSWVRIPVAILSCALILSFLIILRINWLMAFGLYTIGKVFEDKGQTVFSEDYQKVIAATPQLKPGSPILFWAIFIFVFIGFLVLEFLMTWEERAAGP